jgi:Family of unknown function (DUF6169)
MSGYPYELAKHSEDEYYYVFKNKKEFEYTIKFKPSFWLGQKNTFEITIENESLLPSSDGFDTAINATIIAIMYNFLEFIPDCAISYVCDNTGGQQRSAARAILFHRWFLKYNNGDFIH